MTVTVKKLGGSVAVVIPKVVAREMALTEGTDLEISGDRDTILLRKPRRQPRRARRPLAQIVSQIKPASYRRRSREFIADRPVGREIW